MHSLFAILAAAITISQASPIVSGIDHTICLDVVDGDSADGTKVQIYSCNGNSQQDWTYTSGTLQSMGKCLEVVDDNAEAGQQLEISTCIQGNTNQQWVRNDTSWVWQDYYCLDLSNGDTSDGTLVQIWPCFEYDINQVWNYAAESATTTTTTTTTIEDATSSSSVGTGTTSTTLSTSTASATSSSTSIVASSTASSASSAGQSCSITSSGGAAIQPAIASNLCLDTSGASSSNGAIVVVSTCSGSDTQAWTATGNSLTLLGGTKCLDLPDGDTTPGTSLQIWDCYAGNANQQWEVVGNTLVFENQYCVDLTNGNAASGQAMQMWPCFAGDVNQEFNWCGSSTSATSSTPSISTISTTSAASTSSTVATVSTTSSGPTTSSSSSQSPISSASLISSTSSTTISTHTTTSSTLAASISSKSSVSPVTTTTTSKSTAAISSSSSIKSSTVATATTIALTSASTSSYSLSTPKLSSTTLVATSTSKSSTILLTSKSTTTLVTSTSSKSSAAASTTGVTSGNKIRLIGRSYPGSTSLSSPQTLSWAASGVTASFSGSSFVNISLVATGTPIFRVNIDGVDVSTITAGSTPVQFTGLVPSSSHVITLTKINEAAYGTAIFQGFTINSAGLFLQPSSTPTRRIEIIGDGLTNGLAVLGSGGTCPATALNEDATISFGAVAASDLGAEVSIIAATAWGIASDNNGNTANAIPNIYSDAVSGDASKQWNFASEPVDAVVIRLGTNDWLGTSGGDPTHFIAAYGTFLATIRSKYPTSLILCAYGPWERPLAQAWITNAVQQVVAARKATGDKSVQIADLSTGLFNVNTGAGVSCAAHPNQAIHSLMGMRLASYIQAGKGWW